MKLRPIDNSNGRVTAMTLITPIRRWAVWSQRWQFFWSRQFPATSNKLRRLEIVHFGWWALLSKIPDNGPPQRPEKLNHTYLLFESNFDGEWAPYIDTFGQVLRWRVNLVWWWSHGYPGSRPTGPAISYVDANQFPVEHYYAAYPEASNKMVRAALRLSEQFHAFEAATAHVDDEDFAVAYQRFVGDAQRCL